MKLDGCKGAPLATIPLDAAQRESGVDDAVRVVAADQRRARPLLRVRLRGNDPLWSIDSVQLVPAETLKNPHKPLQRRTRSCDALSASMPLWHEP